MMQTTINLDALERDAIAGKVRWQDVHALVSHARHLTRCLAESASADDDPTSKAQYRRMFSAACADLGLVNEKLRLDPNDGGAEPILAAIDELLATSTAAGQGDLVAAIRAMLTMLDAGEWAEHVAATTGSGNPLAQRLEDAITDLHNEASANRDMLEDARSELAALARVLGVAYEPHQTLRERLLEAAQSAAAKTTPSSSPATHTEAEAEPAAHASEDLYGCVPAGDVDAHRFPVPLYRKETSNG